MEEKCKCEIKRSLFMCHPKKWIKTDYSMCEKCKKIFSKIIVEVKGTAATKDASPNVQIANLKGGEE